MVRTTDHYLIPHVGGCTYEKAIGAIDPAASGVNRRTKKGLTRGKRSQASSVPCKTAHHQLLIYSFLSLGCHLVRILVQKLTQRTGLKDAGLYNTGSEDETDRLLAKHQAILSAY
jgi:hypothetical protein